MAGCHLSFYILSISVLVFQSPLLINIIYSKKTTKQWFSTCQSNIFPSRKDRNLKYFELLEPLLMYFPEKFLHSGQLFMEIFVHLKRYVIMSAIHSFVSKNISNRQYKRYDFFNFHLYRGILFCVGKKQEKRK